MFKYTVLNDKYIFIGIFSNYFELRLNYMIFGRISFIQEELLVNVKREMTYVYFQYSCFVTPLCQDTLNTGWQIVTFREIFLFAVFYFSMEYFF